MRLKVSAQIKFKFGGRSRDIGAFVQIVVANTPKCLHSCYLPSHVSCLEPYIPYYFMITNFP
jgi:hypothetical protein